MALCLSFGRCLECCGEGGVGRSPWVVMPKRMRATCGRGSSAASRTGAGGWRGEWLDVVEFGPVWGAAVGGVRGVGGLKRVLAMR